MKFGWSTAKEWLPATRRFFRHSVWEARLEDLPASQAAGYRAARILYSTWKGYREHHLTSRAAALTYYTVLSMVPFLAFAFAVIKGFGAYARFIDHTVRPYLHATFGANPPLLAALETVLDFVQDTDVARLGTAGVLVLVYGAVSLLSNIESALNAIWGARSERSLLRQVTDYTTLIVTTPLLMLVATTFATAAQSSEVVTFLRNTWALGLVIDFLLGIASLLVTIAAMIALYIILPNVKVRTSSAMLGGLVSGLLWQAALLVHVNSQAGVARYNALYSGFVALPIFLVWTYISWIVVLIGGLVAASHQNERAARQHLRAEAVDQALREALALAIIARITSKFLAGEARPTSAALAEQFEVSPIVVEDVLHLLERAEVAAKVISDGDIGYLPGRDVDQLGVTHVLCAIRRKPASDPLRLALAQEVGTRLLSLVDEGATTGPGRRADLTLRELAQIARPEPSAQLPRSPAVSQEESSDERPRAVVDAKQPELPS